MHLHWTQLSLLKKIQKLDLILGVMCRQLLVQDLEVRIGIEIEIELEVDEGKSVLVYFVWHIVVELVKVVVVF